MSTPLKLDEEFLRSRRALLWTSSIGCIAFFAKSESAGALKVPSTDLSLPVLVFIAATLCAIIYNFAQFLIIREGIFVRNSEFLGGEGEVDISQRIEVIISGMESFLSNNMGTFGHNLANRNSHFLATTEQTLTRLEGQIRSVTMPSFDPRMFHPTTEYPTMEPLHRQAGELYQALITTVENAKYEFKALGEIQTIESFQEFDSRLTQLENQFGHYRDIAGKLSKLSSGISKVDRLRWRLLESFLPIALASISIGLLILRALQEGGLELLAKTFSPF